MFCSCIYTDGDATDRQIRYICGHHPNCVNFKVEKDLFKHYLDLQISKEVAKKIYTVKAAEEEAEPKDKIIVKRLYKWLHKRSYPICHNSYVFNWESDLLSVAKTSGYITEYEIKISRNDFKADFKKLDKHKMIEDVFKYKFNLQNVPNYFYYATTPGLLDKKEIPVYAGLIEVGVGVRIVKKAPIIHRHLHQLEEEIVKKVYFKYWKL